MTAPTTPPSRLLEADVARWDAAADLVVVGFGAAGSAAAIAGREAGASVTVLEKSPDATESASAQAGGHFYLGGGTAVQKACGFEDTADAMYRYLEALCPEPEPAKLRLYADGSVGHFDWLERQGMLFERTYFPHKSPLQEGTECLIWTGNEKVWPFRDKAKPAPRGHKVAMAGNGGPLVMRVLSAAAERAGAAIRYGAGATNLIVAEDGRVIGVRAEQNGAPLFVRAGKGVVLAAGGYIRNRALVQKHAPWLPDDLILQGGPWDDGMGVMLGQSAGGATQRMDKAFVTSPFYPPADMLKGILVNKTGGRFVAEDCYHGRTAGISLEQPDGIVYLILDQPIFGTPPYDFFEQHVVAKADTLAEIERALTLPGGSLQQTVRRYNEPAARGEDPEFHKYGEWVRPLDTPPFYAYDLSKGRAKYSGFSLGGLRTSVDCQVLDSAGRAIAGLYAAGATALNIAQDSRGYSSGTCLGESSFFGRRAGRIAAQS